MSKKSLIVYGALVALGCGSLTFTQSASAANMFNMMNPSKWMGGDRGGRRYYDDYGYDRYRYGGPYGGYGPGWGGYGPGYGYGPGWGGYGPGWGGYGGGPYGYGQQQKSAPPPPPLPQ